MLSISSNKVLLIIVLATESLDTPLWTIKSPLVTTKCLPLNSATQFLDKAPESSNNFLISNTKLPPVKVII